MSKKVLIVGGGLVVANELLERLRAENPGYEVVTAEEAKERGLHESFEITARPQMAEPIILKNANYGYGFEGGGESKRAARRKQERAKKKKRFGYGK